VGREGMNRDAGKKVGLDINHCTEHLYFSEHFD
jgi:hypothetical protein